MIFFICRRVRVILMMGVEFIIMEIVIVLMGAMIVIVFFLINFNKALIMGQALFGQILVSVTFRLNNFIILVIKKNVLVILVS